MFKKLQQKIVYENKWMTVYEDDIEFPNGSKGIYGFVQRPNGAGALVVNQNQEVLLIQQYRYPIQDWEWGIPGGAIDEGENPSQSVKREVEEETGLKLSEVKEMGSFYPLSSCSTERVHLFLAIIDVTSPDLKSSEPDESVPQMKFVKITEALRMIDDGQITDASTCNALQILSRKIDLLL